MEGGRGRRVGRGREGPLWKAGAPIHGVREDLALAAAKQPRNRRHQSLTKLLRSAKQADFHLEFGVCLLFLHKITGVNVKRISGTERGTASVINSS